MSCLRVSMLCALAAAGCELSVVVGDDCRGASCAGAPASASAQKHPCQTPACLRAQRCSERRPLMRASVDMYLMIDASGSQLFSWSTMQRGLSLFFDDPASSGVGVGLQFFGQSCDPETYATPAAPIMPIPQSASTLLAAFPLAPTQETPTRPALDGAIRYARRWQEAHPTRTSVVALVTDGFPEECDSNPDNVSAVADEGLMGSPSIRTFVVGVDAIGNIFKFASAVSTLSGAPAVLPLSSQTPEALAGGFASVRDSASACRFQLQEPISLAADGSSLLLQMPGDGTSVEEPLVADAGACDMTSGGVYVDPDQPQQLIACPASCTRLTAAGSTELLTGCPDG